MDNDTWQTMYDANTQKLSSHYYTPYFVKILNEYENVPCVLVSNSYYFMKNGITIRFVCNIETCKRKYKFVHQFSRSKKQVFQLKRAGAVRHVEMKSRSGSRALRKLRRSEKSRRQTRASLYSIARRATDANDTNVNDSEIFEDMASGADIADGSEILEIFESIKQETIND